MKNSKEHIWKLCVLHWSTFFFYFTDNKWEWENLNPENSSNFSVGLEITHMNYKTMHVMLHMRNISLKLMKSTEINGTVSKHDAKP